MQLYHSHGCYGTHSWHSMCGAPHAVVVEALSSGGSSISRQQQLSCMLLLGSRAGASMLQDSSGQHRSNCCEWRLKHTVPSCSFGCINHSNQLLPHMPCHIATLTTLLLHRPAVCPVIPAALKDALQSLQQGQQLGIGAWSGTV